MTNIKRDPAVLVRITCSQIKGGVKGTVMQIEKTLINDCLRVSKVF